MAHGFRPNTIFISLLLASLSSCLQVTPGSPCLTRCIDDPLSNPSDPNSSNTSEKDITCTNAGYSATTVGQKFQTCVSCLQTSNYSTSAESDQAWFLYNLRYALGYCLFGYPNNSTTIGGPCLSELGCGSLSAGLEFGILNPPNGSTYGYCTTNGGVFMGSNLSPCTSCLAASPDKSYLSNFLIALQAGCEQMPAAGATISLSGTVFNSTAIAITTPLVGVKSATSAGSSGLSIGAKIGIIVAGLVVALILLGVGIICWKKRLPRRAVESHFDPRFGSDGISAPNAGSYTNRHRQIRNSVTVPNYSRMDYQDSEGLSEKAKVYSPSSIAFSSASGSHPSSPVHMVTLPVHSAYIPGAKLNSPSIGTSEAQVSPNVGPMRKFSRPFSPISPGNPTSPLRSAASAGTPRSAASVRTPRSATSAGTPRSATSAGTSRYSPSAYVDPDESESAYAARQPSRHHVVPVRPAREDDDFGQAERPDTPQSIEQWPGSM